MLIILIIFLWESWEELCIFFLKCLNVFFFLFGGIEIVLIVIFLLSIEFIVK